MEKDVFGNELRQFSVVDSAEDERHDVMFLKDVISVRINAASRFEGMKRELNRRLILPKLKRENWRIMKRWPITKCPNCCFMISEVSRRVIHGQGLNAKLQGFKQLFRGKTPPTAHNAREP